MDARVQWRVRENVGRIAGASLVGALVEKNRGIGGWLREWEWKIDCVWVEG